MVPKTAAGATLSVLLVLLAAAPSGATGQVCDYFNSELLVDVDWLEENIDHPTLRIIDFARSPEDYSLGHIPCAAFVDRGAIAATIDGTPQQLLPVAELDELLERAGVSDESTVVIYDDAGGLWASRLLWAMEYMGHRDVRLLNGGWYAWISGDRDVCLEPAAIARGELTPSIEQQVLATRDWVLAALDDPGVRVLDVRTPDEYSGVDVRAVRGGYIPGAVNIEWLWALDEAESQFFLPSDELLAVYETAGIERDVEVVTYCQAGVRAAHTYLALRLLGYPKVRVYDGSWVEWGSDPDTPIVTETVGE